MSDAMQNIEELKQRFEQNGGSLEDQATIVEWEKNLKRAMLKAKLSENDAVKMLLEEMHKRIAGCNRLLTTDRKMDDRFRDKVFERRDAFEWLIKQFEIAKATVAAIGAKAKDELET